jgi:hypothetical protein
MANGIFLATAMFNGEPTFFQYTMRENDPVVIVELYKPPKDDLIPNAVMTTEIKKINPLDYPEPLRQHLLSTPHLERSLADSISKEVSRIGQEQWGKMLADHEVNKIPTQEEWNTSVKRIINNVRGSDA